MNLFDLYATITLDKSGVDGGITETQKKFSQAEKSIENIGTAVKNAAKTFATIGAGIGAAGSAVYAFANKIAQNGDNIDKMSQKLGMSATAYQEWSHIMEHCGTSIDSLQAGMKTLASAAETGSDAFEKLGLTQEKIAGLSQEDLFSATIEALQNVESETERTYLAGQLLGRGATELGPLLNTSAEEIEAMRQNLHDMGAVMSDEAVKNSAAFQDSLTNLKTAFSGASNSLGEKLIPNITSLMDHITDFIAGGGLDRLIDGFTNLAPIITGAAAAMVAYKAASAISGVIDAVTKATEAQSIAQAALNAVMNANPFVLVATLIASVGTALVTLYATNEDFRNKVTETWEKIKGVFSGAWDGIKTVWDAVKPYFDSLWKGIETIFSVVESVLSGDFSGAWDAIKSNLSEWADYFDGVWEDIQDVFSGAWEAFKNIGKNIVGGLKQGILDAWTNFSNWVYGKFDNLVGGVKNLLGIASPSKVFASIGGYMAEGLGAGWEREYGNIDSRIRKDLDYNLDYSLRTTFVKPESSVREMVAAEISSLRSAFNNLAASTSQDTPIVVQVVLDGKVVGETSYQYIKDRQRAYGVT